jgi:large subunit ribosomal protein L13
VSTYMAKPADIKREWFLVDATNQTLGRLASKIAEILRGKHKTIFTPHLDTGDFIIVINAEKIKLTGNKLKQKKYYHHSGYPGGIKETVYEELIEKKPEFIIEKAVKGMLPHNKLGSSMFKKLKVYAGSEHPHQAQQPKELNL